MQLQKLTPFLVPSQLTRPRVGSDAGPRRALNVVRHDYANSKTFFL